MKPLTFEQFCNICAAKKVVHLKSGLRADFDLGAAELTKRINERTGGNSFYMSDFTVYVGGDNDREGFELNPESIARFWVDEVENKILVEWNQNEEWFTVNEWPKF